MSTITLRSVKGSGLTNNEIDANFSNLNTDKAETLSPALTGTPTAPTAAAATNTGQIATTAHVFAERTNTATLTNKTLTSPALNTPTLGTEAVVITTNNLPAIRPSLNLDFANSQTVDPRITFTRASTATRINSRGLIESVASGVPRIDYDPVTGACKGLLIEESRTNLLTYSEQFDNAAWVKNLGVVTPDSGTSPDGTTTADNVASTGAGFYRVLSGIATTAHTVSIYAKHVGGSGNMLLGFDASPATARTAFNLQTGAISYNEANVVSSSMTHVGGGWYRCAVTATITSSAPVIVVYNGISGANWLVWGAQLEAGAFPTSYIPTVASQVTRAADVASMTGTNFSSWYRADGGSFVATADVTFSGSSFPTLADVCDGTVSNIIYVSSRSSTLQGRMEASVSGASQVASSAGALTSGVAFTESVAYKLNDYALSVSGGAVVTDVAATVPTVNKLDIGCGRGVSDFINGHLARLAYYPKRCSNAELVALSTQ